MKQILFARLCLCVTCVSCDSKSKAFAAVKILAASILTEGGEWQTIGDAAKGKMTYGNEQHQWVITNQGSKVKIKFSFMD